MGGPNRRWIAAGALLAGTAGACAPGAPELDRARLLGLGTDDPVQRAIAEPARIVAVYWPATDCLGCQGEVQHALARAAAEVDGIRVLSVIPRVEANGPPELGLPGRTLELPPESYAVQTASLPAPRLEVWGAGGEELLLFRRLPPVVDAGALFDEIRSCLSFSSSSGPEPSRSST